MRTTLKSILLAASLLLCLSAQAVVVDSTNADNLPSYNQYGYEPYHLDFLPQTFQYSSIVYQYTPSFDYTLTGLFTRFATPSPLDATQIEISIWETNPFASIPSSSLLSFSFALTPGYVDLIPSPSYNLLTGTNWLGSSSLPPLALSATVPYYIRLRALNSDGVPVDLNSVGVNFSAASALRSLPTNSPQTWLPTFLPTSTGPEPVAVYTDPIFRFEGTAAVPEPSTYGLIGAFGLMSFAAFRRRFARKA